MATFNHISGQELRAYPCEQFVDSVSKREQMFLGASIQFSADHAVQPRVIAIRHDKQVFRAIIKAVSIFVMNGFVAIQSATENAFHYQAMFCASFPIDRMNTIPTMNRAFLVRSPQVSRIEQFFRAIFHAKRMLTTKSPQLIVVACPLFRLLLTPWNITVCRQWCSVRYSRTTFSRHDSNFNIGVAV